MKTRSKYLVWPIICAMLLFSGRCTLEEAPVESGEAWQEIILSVSVKYSECGSFPGEPFLMVDAPQEKLLHSCSLAIINAPCPFDSYPLLCYQLFLDTFGSSRSGD